MLLGCGDETPKIKRIITKFSSENLSMAILEDRQRHAKLSIVELYISAIKVISPVYNQVTPVNLKLPWRISE